MLKLKWKIWKNDRKIKKYYKELQKNWIKEIKALATF